MHVFKMATYVNVTCFAFFNVLVFICVCLAERHSIKIVDEPSNYGIMNQYQVAGNTGTSQDNKLKMRIKPSNFSGPDLFHRLVGKCFSKTDSTYKYELCPFSNTTQHEQSLRWNPYSGILGVWQEWEIVNNTFVAMVMVEGDKCGNLQRTTKVFFVCGKENRVLNVTEPTTCNYHLNFSTPYVCHKHAMLVYPTLSEQLQTEWGLLEGELSRGEITQKGYNKYLRQIFVKAGYMLSNEEKQRIAAEAVEKEKQAVKAEDGQFDSLYQCQAAYRTLQKEVEELREVIQNQENNMMDNERRMHELAADYDGMD